MASTSSAINPLGKHDVFLSFRGTDTRNSFVSFLHRELVDRNGIETYIDDRLQGGEEIEPALLRKIEESLISVVILSKNYADSTFCLRELSKILDCKETKGQNVIPVFYKVNPDDVRNQCGRFGKALRVHERKRSLEISEEERKDRLQEVRKWRRALTEIANLKGWDSNVTMPETKLIQEIVDDIRTKLTQMPSSGSPSSNSERFVGITSRVKKIESLLSFGSPSVLIVGIWGMGGIGKSTTAEVVYGRNSRQFEGSCFFRNVREESKKDGLVHVLQEILRKVLKNEDLNMGTNGLDPEIKRMLQRKKVLIVLDDVNSSQDLKHLVGEDGLFGKGSRIIVTSRDRQVLINECEGDKIYEVQNLDEGDALELFSLHAFKNKNPREGYKQLSESVVSCVKGIPLVLEVLGSSLYKRSEEHWESKVAELRKNRGEDIKKALQRCYDELGRTEKKIFLDIACFFGRRYDGDLVRQTLDLEERNKIDRLTDMCLIKIVDNKIWIHDLVQQLGREIVHHEHKDPGKRSRLWEAEDVYHILTNHQGTEKVEAISLESSTTKGMNFSPAAFKGIYNLRLLKFLNHDINLPHGLEFLSNELRSLCWHRYPLKSLPSNFSGVKLVELDMSYSELEQLWNEHPPLIYLKSMTLDHSRKLSFINADLSKFPNLEVLHLASCRSLCTLPSSIGNLSQLTQLDLSHCESLRSLPDTIGELKCLSKLELSHCSNLASLPDSIGKLKCLSTLYLSHCSKLASLPNTIGLLNCLSTLNLFKCSKLASLPDTIGQLKCLSTLDLSCCSELASLPNSIGQLQCLSTLDLSYCSQLASLPDSIGQLECLSTLDLYYCLELTSLPDSISQLECLSILDLSYCLELPSLPNSIGELKYLLMLNLSHCPKLASLPDSIGQLKCLSTLNLSCCLELGILNYCSRLVSLPDSFGQLQGLSTLGLTHCSKLASLPDSIGQLKCLSTLDLSYCSELGSLPNSIGQLECLSMLNLSYCSELASLPDSIGELTCLSTLDLSCCSTLASLPDSIGKLTCLSTLDLSHCSKLGSLPDSIGQLKCLSTLKLFVCSKLASLPDSIGQLKCLSTLGISYCIKLTSLPHSIGQLNCLSKLELSCCSNLTSLPDSIGQLEYLSTLKLVHCSELASLPDSIGQLKCLPALDLTGCSKLASIPDSIGQVKCFQC